MRKKDSRFLDRYNQLALSAERGLNALDAKECRAHLRECRRLVRELAAHPSCRDDEDDEDEETRSGAKVATKGPQTFKPSRPQVELPTKQARSAAGVRCRSARLL